MNQMFQDDDRRAALIVIPTVARPSVLVPAFARLLSHLDGIPVHICVSINAVNEPDGDASQEQVIKLWQSYGAEGMLPVDSLLTVYRHPGPCGFGGALNRGVLAAATPQLFTMPVQNDALQIEDRSEVDILNERIRAELFDKERLIGFKVNPSWPADMVDFDQQEQRNFRFNDACAALSGDDASPGLPPLIIFYNDDLEAADGWLAELVAAARPDQPTIFDITESPRQDGVRNPRSRQLYGRVGLIGPVTNNAAGMQCLTGQVRDWQRLGTDRFSAEWRKHNSGNTLTADFLSGFCMGITRDCLKALWGALPDRDGPHLFDEATYPVAGYEDNDLCVRAAEAGYRAAICAGSFVGHIGHQSFDALFPEMQRGMRNRMNYYRKWRPWVESRAGRLVAALRVKIEVPHDLRLLRPTLQRLGELVDGVAVLFTADPADALTHPEGEAEVRSNEIPQEDLDLLRDLKRYAASGKDRTARVHRWIKSCVSDGASARHRKAPSVGVSFWPTDLPMNERDERNAAMGMAESMGASWIWSIDHDEVVEPRIKRAHLDRWMTHPDPLVSSLDQGFYTTWDTLRMYRLDSPWGDGGTMTGGMRGWRLWRVNNAAPGRILAGTENGLHCGNSPPSDMMTKRHAAIRIHHHGYYRAMDRERKRERYQRQDPTPDRILVGATNYNHLTYEEQVNLSRFMPRSGIGQHMLVHAGEDPGGVMAVLDQLHAMTDMSVLVWTSDPADPKRAVFEEIAGLFGAVLVDHPVDPERGGLADARNAGIDALARYESDNEFGIGWTLFMDPDEQFADGAMTSLRRLADATDCWAWLFEFINPYQSGDPSRSESLRMVRLHPRMRMDGRVHEGFAEAIRGLKRQGYTDIVRTAPFMCLNHGLRVSDEVVQAKYDRYLRWAVGAIRDGVGRSVDWTTVGLYFANEGLWKAPERCFSVAVGLDPDSFVAARELAVHYLRMARGPAALSAQRLPQGDPRREHMERVVDMCDKEAPPIAGMGTARTSPRFTEESAMALLDLLDAAVARHTAKPEELEPPALEPHPAD